jgi:hypothetical protein
MAALIAHRQGRWDPLRASAGFSGAEGSGLVLVGVLAEGAEVDAVDGVLELAADAG